MLANSEARGRPALANTGQRLARIGQLWLDCLLPEQLLPHLGNLLDKSRALPHRWARDVWQAAFRQPCGSAIPSAIVGLAEASSMRLWRINDEAWVAESGDVEELGIHECGLAEVRAPRLRRVARSLRATTPRALQSCA